MSAIAPMDGRSRKSTMGAVLLAKQLDMWYVDTGAMYRVNLRTFSQRHNPDDENAN